MILLWYTQKLKVRAHEQLPQVCEILVKGQNCNVITFFLDLNINTTNKITIVLIMSKIYWVITCQPSKCIVSYNPYKNSIK